MIMLNVYDSHYKALGVYDEYDSLVWRDVYSGIGDFEITSRSSNLTNFFKVDYIIQIHFSESAMIVESVGVTLEDGEKKYIVRGRSFVSVLNRRIFAVHPKERNGHMPLDYEYEDFIRKSIELQIDSKVDSKRRGIGDLEFIFDGTVGTYLKYYSTDYEAYFPQLGDFVFEILSKYRDGILMYITPNPDISVADKYGYFGRPTIRITKVRETGVSLTTKNKGLLSVSASSEFSDTPTFAVVFHEHPISYIESNVRYGPYTKHYVGSSGYSVSGLNRLETFFKAGDFTEVHAYTREPEFWDDWRYNHYIARLEASVQKKLRTGNKPKIFVTGDLNPEICQIDGINHLPIQCRLGDVIEAGSEKLVGAFKNLVTAITISDEYGYRSVTAELTGITDQEA